MSDACFASAEHARLEAWFGEHLTEFSGPLSISLITGGRSNLTYRATDSEGHQWILRRPPLGDLLPRAHDVAREYRILHAMGHAGYPVPGVRGMCVDPGVLGAPFFVMGMVVGLVVRTREDATKMLSSAGRASIGTSLATTLARLHSQTPVELGLSDLGPGSGYLERQLSRWNAQYKASRGDHDIAEIATAHALLSQAQPKHTEVVVVHGDFKLDNVMVDGAGRVRAVLDWELCTLGDPLADLGTMLAYWEQPGEEAFTDEAATASEGFVSRQAVTKAYAEASGRSVDDVAYYLALGYWKIACISMGVYSRYATGSMADDGYNHTDTPRRVRLLASKAVESVTCWLVANGHEPGVRANEQEPGTAADR